MPREVCRTPVTVRGDAAAIGQRSDDWFLRWRPTADGGDGGDGERWGPPQGAASGVRKRARLVLRSWRVGRLGDSPPLSGAPALWPVFRRATDGQAAELEPITMLMPDARRVSVLSLRVAARAEGTSEQLAGPEAQVSRYVVTVRGRPPPSTSKACEPANGGSGGEGNAPLGPLLRGGE